MGYSIHKQLVYIIDWRTCVVYVRTHACRLQICNEIELDILLSLKTNKNVPFLESGGEKNVLSVYALQKCVSCTSCTCIIVPKGILIIWVTGNKNMRCLSKSYSDRKTWSHNQVWVPMCTYRYVHPGNTHRYLHPFHLYST